MFLSTASTQYDARHTLVVADDLTPYPFLAVPRRPFSCWISGIDHHARAWKASSRRRESLCAISLSPGPEHGCRRNDG